MMQLLEKLTTAIVIHYQGDRTRPGVVLAKLEDGFYASVARYETPWTKVVVCHVRGHKTLEGAVTALAFKWCARVRLPALIQPDMPRDRFLLIEIK